MAEIEFAQIQFGLRDARKEALEHRDLLLGGYFDLNNAYRKIVDDSRFLVLGYKGSGKSALAQHMRLRMSEVERDSTIRTILLNELSFHEFAAIVPAETEWQSRFAKVWALVLWLQLIDLFRKDPESPQRHERDFQRATAALESARLLPVRDLPEAVRDYAHHTLDVPGISGPNTTSPASSRMLSLSHLVDQLRDVSTRTPSSRRTILVIDGTDEIFSGEEITYEVIASLLEASSRLNGELAEANVRAKIVVLCRTDLFNRLPGSNKNKMRGDSGIEFNWFEDVRHLETSALAQLANQKARVADPSIVDIFSEYLPAEMSRGRKPSQPTIRLLLEYTRHTPRDLLQLLTYIGEVQQPGSRRLARTPETVARGIASYSRNYFAAEIQDEVWGHLQIEERAAILPILTAVGRTRFRAEQFSSVAERLFPDLDSSRVLEVLYDCSAVGNISAVGPAGSRISRVAFKYRNPDSNLNLSEDIFVHNAWRTKLNIVDALPGPPRDLVASRAEASTNAERPPRLTRSRTRTRVGEITTGPIVNSQPPLEIDQGKPSRSPRRAVREQGPPNSQDIVS